MTNISCGVGAKGREPGNRGSRRLGSTRTLLVLATVACGCVAEPAPAVLLDPSRSYDDRLALTALLESAHPYPGTGADAWPDHRAGIVLQTEWQLASGRTPRDTDGTLDGWWPNVNWTLSVWQFQAQQRFRGEFADVGVIEPELSRLEMPDAVGRMWAEYYEAIDRARDDVAAGRLSAREQSARSRELQRMMWDVHMAAVDAGLLRNRDRLASMPAAEARFARAWGYTAVEFIAAGDFPSDRDSIGRTQAIILPRRVVVDGDFGDGTQDLTWHQHMAIHAMDALHEADKLANGGLFRAWQEALAEPRCGALCPYILDQALSEQLDGLPSYLSSVLDVIQGTDRRPAWAANGTELTCKGSDASRLSCNVGSTTRTFDCSMASGVREWSCRTCVGSGTAVFTRLFCPDGSARLPGGACSIEEAAEVASSGC